MQVARLSNTIYFYEQHLSTRLLIIEQETEEQQATVTYNLKNNVFFSQIEL
jgi:hypothetical protein